MRKKAVQAGANHQYHHTQVAAPGTKVGRLDPEVEYEGEVLNAGGRDDSPIDTDSLNYGIPASNPARKRVKYSGRCSNAYVPKKNRKCFNLAMIFLRAKVVAENPWPTEDQGKEMIHESWKEAREFRLQDLSMNGFSAEHLEEDMVPDLQSKAKVCITGPVSSMGQANLSSGLSRIDVDQYR